MSRTSCWIKYKNDEGIEAVYRIPAENTWEAVVLTDKRFLTEPVDHKRFAEVLENDKRRRARHR